MLRIPSPIHHCPLSLEVKACWHDCCFYVRAAALQFEKVTLFKGSSSLLVRSPRLAESPGRRDRLPCSLLATTGLVLESAAHAERGLREEGDEGEGIQRCAFDTREQRRYPNRRSDARRSSYGPWDTKKAKALSEQPTNMPFARKLAFLIPTDVSVNISHNFQRLTAITTTLSLANSSCSHIAVPFNAFFSSPLNTFHVHFQLSWIVQTTLNDGSNCIISPKLL